MRGRFTHGLLHKAVDGLAIFAVAIGGLVAEFLFERGDYAKIHADTERPRGKILVVGHASEHAANHAIIHAYIARALGVEVLLDIENHHNFAWRERHRLPDGSEGEVIVHRKGATPAGVGVLGIIPGSMGTPGYVVRGKGVAASLNSAAHGAGRRMSRTKAKEMFTWDVAQRFLRERGVTLLSAGLDEVPMAYKDIDEVMAAQSDLVEALARFEPRLVKMAPSGEPPED